MLLSCQQRLRISNRVNKCKKLIAMCSQLFYEYKIINDMQQNSLLHEKWDVKIYIVWRDTAEIANMAYFLRTVLEQ